MQEAAQMVLEYAAHVSLSLVAPPKLFSHQKALESFTPTASKFSCSFVRMWFFNVRKYNIFRVCFNSGFRCMPCQNLQMQQQHMPDALGL